MQLKQRLRDAWRVFKNGMPEYPEATVIEKVLVVDRDVVKGKVYVLQGMKSNGFSGTRDKGYYLTCADAFSDGAVNDTVIIYEGYLSLDKKTFYPNARFSCSAVIVNQKGNNKAYPCDGDPSIEGSECQ